MTTLAEVIAKTLAGENGDWYVWCREPDKQFLVRWAEAIVKEPMFWKRVAKTVPDSEWLVGRAMFLREVAEEDAKCGADSYQHLGPAHHKRLSELADMAATLADHYKPFADYCKQKGLATPRLEWIKGISFIEADLRERADWAASHTQPLIHPVYVSQKSEERLLFMQRMSVTMMDKLGDWNDPIVAAIASVVYHQAAESDDRKHYPVSCTEPQNGIAVHA
jgi:hypothetical protein